MPWRGTRDAYRVWVSEIMLQQTRVAAVVPYYEKFMRQFPAVRALARADAESVLKYWAGLGYYSRVRNLHRAAREIMARHGGKFPRERETALALPGIGKYTAAAVLSIAYGQPLAVLDGNVARVLARLGAIRGDLRTPQRWMQLEERAQTLLVATKPGEWNQVMMELGATVCTPRAPRCEVCPAARWCQARKLGITDQLPAGRKKPAAVKVRIAAAVLLDAKGRTLLVRQDGGLFSKMWQFPAVEVKRDAAAELREHLRGILAEGNSKTLTQRKQREAEYAEERKPRERQEDLTQRTQRAQGDTEESMVALEGVRHSVTFREITLLPFVVRVGASISNLKFEISKGKKDQDAGFFEPGATKTGANFSSAHRIGTPRSGNEGSRSGEHSEISNLKFGISKGKKGQDAGFFEPGATKTRADSSSALRAGPPPNDNESRARVRVVGLGKIDRMAVSSATRKIARVAREYVRG